MDQVAEDLLKEESLEKTGHGGWPGQTSAHGVRKGISALLVLALMDCVLKFLSLV